MSDSTKVDSFKRTVVKAALKVLPLSMLQVDHSYQREVKVRHKRIVADFNADALGIPLVGEREDGTVWIVDGLQRITALRKLGKKDARCEVFASMGTEHEAEVFKLVNMNRTRLTPAEEFRALLAGHDELAWGIKEAVEAEGFKIVFSKSVKQDCASKYLTCISALTTAARYGGTESIRFALRCARNSWLGDHYATHHIIIGGMVTFFRRHNKVVDEERLVARLQLTTPQKIMYAATQMCTGNRKDVPCADVIDKFYQKRRGKQ